jgi:hypothetical protein
MAFLRRGGPGDFRRIVTRAAAARERCVGVAGV